MRISTRPFWGSGPEWTLVVGYLRMSLYWEDSEDLEEGMSLGRQDQDSLLMFALPVLSYVILNHCIIHSWDAVIKMAGSSPIMFFSLKTTGEAGSSHRPDSGQRYVTEGLSYTVSPPLICPLSLFFCLWREEALRTSRKVEPQMEGVWVLKWHVKGSHTKNSLWVWIGNSLSLRWTINL